MSGPNQSNQPSGDNEHQPGGWMTRGTEWLRGHWMREPFNGLIAVATIFYVCFAALQWRTMRQQLGEMQVTTRATQGQIDALRAVITMRTHNVRYLGEHQNGSLLWHIIPVWENSGNTIATELHLLGAYGLIAQHSNRLTVVLPDMSNTPERSGSYLASRQTINGQDWTLQGRT